MAKPITVVLGRNIAVYNRQQFTIDSSLQSFSTAYNVWPPVEHGNKSDTEVDSSVYISLLQS